MNETTFQDGLFAVETAPRMLTVKQPWAWSIIHAGKDIENRSRAIRYRGRLLIHAGVRHAPEGDAWVKGLGIDLPEDLPTGVIIGSVDVVGSVQDSSSPWAMDGFHHWKLTNAQPAKRLIPCRGALGLVKAPANWADAF